MAKRRKEIAESEDLLAPKLVKPVAKPVADAPAPCPAILEYTPLMGSDKWRVEKFELFVAEFGMVPPWESHMATFHEMASPYARPWLIVRRLFGVAPVLLPDAANPADYTPLSRAAVGQLIGCTEAQLKAELDAIRAIWNQHAREFSDEADASKIQ